MMKTINDLSFLNETLQTCRRCLLSETFIFGGWAEELWGLSESRRHNDIDLLFRADDLGLVEDAICKEEHWKEIAEKRFPHKRAIIIGDVMVEFVLVKKDRYGFFTNFFSRHRFNWPVDTFSHTTQLLGCQVNIASKSSLIEYRKNHHLKQKAYKEYIAEQIDQAER